MSLPADIEVVHGAWRGTALALSTLNPDLEPEQWAFEEGTSPQRAKVNPYGDPRAYNSLPYVGTGGSGDSGALEIDGRYRGAYAAGVEVLKGDLISYDGALYAANEDLLTEATFDPTDWTLVAGSPTAALAGKLDKDPATADGLVRDSRASGNVLEVRNSTGGLVRFALSATDGQLTINGVKARLAVPWLTGDPDPTANAALPSWVNYELLLGASDPIPAWAANVEGTRIDRLASGSTPPSATFDFQWDGTGLADEATVTAASAGTGDDALTSVTGAPTVETGKLVTPIVEFAAAESPVYIVAPVPAATERRVRGLFETPAAWGATAAILNFRTSGGTLCARLDIGSSVTPGVMRMTNSNNANVLATPNNTISTSTFYRYEVTLKQNATATNGTVRLEIFNMAGSRIFDSGPVIDSTATPVGFGTTHDRLWAGVITSGVTLTVPQGKWRAVSENVDTAIGA